MEGNPIGGAIVTIILGALLLISFISSKITVLIKLKKLKFNKTTGKVIRSINTSSLKYKEEQNEKIFQKHEGARGLYEFLRRIFPTDYEDDHNGPTYASVVQYKVDNREYEVTSSFSSDSKEKKGTIRQVGYNPKDPKDAIIIKDRGNIIAVIAVILLGIGIWLLFS